MCKQSKFGGAKDELDLFFLLVLFVLGSSLQEENVNSNAKRGLAKCPRQYWSASLWCDFFCHEQKETLSGFLCFFVGFFLFVF